MNKDRPDTKIAPSTNLCCYKARFICEEATCEAQETHGYLLTLTIRSAIRVTHVCRVDSAVMFVVRRTCRDRLILKDFESKHA